MRAIITSCVFLLQLAVGACATPTTYLFVFEGDPEQLPLALKAAEEWNRCGSVRVEVRAAPALEGDADAVIKMVHGFPQHPDLRGYTSHHRSLIEYEAEMPTIDTLRTITHEMGHAMGLGHTSREGAMMAPRFAWGEIVPITQADCDELLDC